MEAAFFDLDKTVIARPSMVAFGGHLRREGLVSRRLLLRALWAQLIYLTLGADEARLAKVRDAALRVSKGWEQQRISALVGEALQEVVDPIVYDEALDLIHMHRDAGRKVFIVSSSPEEIVVPLSRYLGADEAIGTRALIDDAGCYTGEVERYCYGPEKARILTEVAEREGVDLSASYAYSDSATDEPMLRAVGHPVAVNPDRELERLARAEGWEVLIFSHRVPLRERVQIPSATTIGVGTLALAAAGGAVFGWWFWREQQRLARTWRARLARLAPGSTLVRVPGIRDNGFRGGGPSWSRSRAGRRGR